MAVVVLALGVSAASAQRNSDAEPLTVRGCLSREGFDLVLRANDRGYQSFDTPDWVWRRQFVLVGDRDILDELTDHERHEVEVIGHLDIPDPDSNVILEPPGGPGNPPGRRDPFGRPGAGVPPDPFGGRRPGLVSRDGSVSDASVLLVTEFEHVSAACRR